MVLHYGIIRQVLMATENTTLIYAIWVNTSPLSHVLCVVAFCGKSTQSPRYNLCVLLSKSNHMSPCLHVDLMDVPQLHKPHVYIYLKTVLTDNLRAWFISWCEYLTDLCSFVNAAFSKIQAWNRTSAGTLMNFPIRAKRNRKNSTD